MRVISRFYGKWGKKTLYLKSEREFTFLEHITRKKGLVNLILKGRTESQRDTWKENVIYITSLFK